LWQPFTAGMAAPGFTGKPVVRKFAGEHELLASPVAYLATLALRHQGRGTVIAVPLESPSGS